MSSQNSSVVSPIIYVSREIERALGKVPSPEYQIISNNTPFGQSVRMEHKDAITLIDHPSGDLLGTTELLQHPDTQALVSRLLSLVSKAPSLLVFKNTLRVETAAKALGCPLLNPPAALSERVENKLSQLRWLGPLAQKYLPPHTAKLAKLITWKNSPFIIQWAHGHTGDGTILVKTPDELRAIQEKFPERMARITAYIGGPSFTVNAVVTPDRVLVGNPSYQITGCQPFTDNQFSTIGNDWGAARAMLSADDFQAIKAIATELGTHLQTDGWKGLFGIDLIRDQTNGRIYLIEINARQPASTTFESYLQETARTKKISSGLTIFEAHILALQGLPIDQDFIQVEDGAQIVQRITKSVGSIFDDAPKKLASSGYSVVTYQNTDFNSDLLRIQSQTSIMAGHNEFNIRGREITEVIKSSHFALEV